MMEWLARQAFAELWALVWHFGIIGIVFFGSLAWAWFMPVFKKTALWVALGAAIIFLTAGIYTKLGADYVQAKWDAAKASVDSQVDSAVGSADDSIRLRTRDPFDSPKH